MTERHSSGERLYRMLLRLYAVAFRHSYGDQLFDAFTTRRELLSYGRRRAALRRRASLRKRSCTHVTIRFT